MTAIAIREPGGPEVLVPQQQPVHSPADGEILVKVAAAGVNRPDVMQRLGKYPSPKGATEIPGLEISGEVVQAGPGVSRWNKGDKVMALVVGGGYAEYCLAFASHALPVPASLSMIEAAAIPETFFTVWHLCSSAASSPPAKRCLCTAARPESEPRQFSSARRSVRMSS
jgi:NADPH2:quinone reductase